MCNGINFSSKFIGYDEIVNCYVGFINSVNSNNKEEDIISRENDANDFFGKPILGVQSFIKHPRGYISYHKSNRQLFNSSSVALMLNNASFPLYFIKELSESNKLFKIKRTSGYEQMAVLTFNGSIFWSESRSSKDGFRWRIGVNFYDETGMTHDDIKQSNTVLEEYCEGDFIKTLPLTDVCKLNGIDTLTFEIKRFKQSLYDTYINDNFEETYKDNDSESDSENDQQLSISNTNKVFINKDKEVDIILNNYHSVIEEEVTKYFESRIDEYICSVKKSLEADNIKVVIN